MLFDILIIILIIAVLGGFGYNRWYAPGSAYPSWNPISIILLVFLILLIFLLLSPWPIRHFYY